MAGVTKAQCRVVIYHLFLSEGWLPAGTTSSNWGEVTIGELQLDDPPLPSDPHFQKKKLALEFQAAFIRFASSIASPLSELKKSTETLAELAVWCFENQGAS